MKRSPRKGESTRERDATSLRHEVDENIPCFSLNLPREKLPTGAGPLPRSIWLRVQETMVGLVGNFANL